MNNTCENENIENFIKQLIDEHGISQQLLITKLTQGRFDISLKEAKEWVDKVLEKDKPMADNSDIKQKINISESKKSPNINLREQEEKNLGKRREMCYRISFVLIILSPIFILGSLGLECMPLFFLGPVCLVAGFVMMNIVREQKK